MHLITIIAVCLFANFAAASVADERKSYIGYRLIQMTPRSRDDVKFLQKLMIDDVHLDFWSEPNSVGKQVEILVGPHHYKRLAQLLLQQNIKFVVTVESYQKVLDPMWRDIEERRSAKGGQVFDIDDFNTFEDVYNWMSTTLMQHCRDGFVCQVYSIGITALGRPIYVFKHSKNGSNRKAYWLDSAIHAREWIAPATIIKTLDNLVRGGDADAVRLTEEYDWYVLPIHNVDGYDFTWTSDRLWRKNRRPNNGSICIGTDLNRNFDKNWGHDGVSHMPCSDIYCGPSPASEPETQAVQSEFIRLASTLLAIVTVHSYGNMWMFPYGNTIDYAGEVCERSDDYDDLMEVSEVTADIIQDTWNTEWSRGTSCEVIYPSTGCTDDYAKGVAGIKYAFCPELRGNSFLIPAAQITQSFQEFWNGIVAMVDAIKVIG